MFDMQRWTECVCAQGLDETTAQPELWINRTGGENTRIILLAADDGRMPSCDAYVCMAVC
jgi:hypothetical protein